MEAPLASAGGRQRTAAGAELTGTQVAVMKPMEVRWREVTSYTVTRQPDVNEGRQGGHRTHAPLWLSGPRRRLQTVRQGTARGVPAVCVGQRWSAPPAGLQAAASSCGNSAVRPRAPDPSNWLTSLRSQKPRSGADVEDGGERALAGHVRYLRVAGLWPRGRGPAYALYAALVQLSAVAYVAVGVASVRSARGDVDAISHTLMHTLEVVSGLLKAGLFFRKRRSFYRLVRDLEGMASADWDVAELRWARRRARRMTAWLSAYIYALILLWLPAPLLAAGDQRLLPVVQLHGVDWARRPAAYGALYALQCAVLLTQVPVVIGLDCFFVAAMLHAGALLQLFLRDLEAAVSAMLLVQLSVIMVGLCMTLYQQTQIKDALTALQYALILPFYTAQLYFYCWTADFIAQQGEALSVAAYSSRWVGAGAAFQRALSVVMARAHRPLLVTAGRLYPVNTAAFVALMKASYSYYTLLRQLDSH
ncbi:odorant receptor 43a-like [Schistocerca americana]|uniref:odorant receptor 43a-like n=1 Tax=Schistocerca americana TaxID=7009 RepID=UPI001F4F8F27|nr:odorant receptor 43a-like [Schistocerca americana]